MREDNLEQELGRRVRDLRIHRRLTQADTAELANVSLGALRHLESGSGATIRTLTRVLAALGQENWLDGLEPGPDAFNPLDLLAARERGVPPKQARRMRARRDVSGVTAPGHSAERKATER